MSKNLTKLSIKKVREIAGGCTDCILKNRVRAEPLISTKIFNNVILIVGPNFAGGRDETLKKITNFLGDDWFESGWYDYVQAQKCSGDGAISNEMCSRQTQNYAFTRSYSGYLIIGRDAHYQFDGDMPPNSIKKTVSGTPILFIPNDPEKVDFSVLRDFINLTLKPN